MSDVMEPNKVMEPEDYFWRIVERDLDEFFDRGGPDREWQNWWLADRYGVPVMAVRVAWIEARRLRRQERGGMGA
jgi:hypothetical protein